MPKKRTTNSQGQSPDINDSLTKDIIFFIRRLMQGAEIYNKELNRRYSISSAQLNCLLALFENGPLPPSQIAKYMMVKSSTVTGVVDRLEQKGLVERVRNSPDRRVITIQLTEAGKNLTANAPPPIQRKIVKGLRNLSKKEIESIALALSKLSDMLDVQDLDVE